MFFFSCTTSPAGLLWNNGWFGKDTQEKLIVQAEDVKLWETVQIHNLALMFRLSRKWTFGPFDLMDKGAF